MKGFFKKYLLIDLSAKHSEAIDIPEDVLSSYLGGKGLASWLLCKFIPPRVDPLEPSNPFIISLGPVTDTRLFGSSRYGIFTKSPLTKIFCETYSGGKAPERLSKVGFDAVVIVGRASEFSYLEITPNDVKFHSASALRGLDCIETEQRLIARHGKSAGVLTVGISAENLVPFSIVSNDFWRSAGRAGAGTVLASKNLKALVFLGGCKREPAEEKSLLEFSQKIFHTYKDSPTAKAYKEKGTPMLVDILNQVSAFPTRYWHQGSFEGYKNINHEAMKRHLSVKNTACAKCFLGCAKLSTIPDGEFAGVTIEGPEYETIYAFGGLCMIDDIRLIVKLNDICDRLGLDTITTGNLVAFAMELSQRGIIKEELKYGCFEDAKNLIYDIAYRRELGQILAKGIKEASQILNAQSLAVHVKGLEPAGYDPRVLKGMALAYAISDRGACHLRSTFYKAELTGLIKPETTEGKAEMLIDFEDRLCIMDTLIVCRFYRDFYGWQQLSDIIKFTVGLELSPQGLKQISQNICNLIRQFNTSEGITERDDTIPERFFNEPLHEFSYNLTKEDFKTLKADYYRLRGWSID